MPYTLDSNDMRFATPQGFNSGDQFFAYLKDSFDTLYAEGATAPKMLSIGLHCRLVGRPGRAASLARFLDYAAGHEKVWIATRLDIARHWIAKHPPPGGWKPSQLTRTLFVERFGGIYEHSRWVAEAAYDAGLTSADDSAEGLAGAMAAAMARGSESRQARADPGASRSRGQARARQAADDGIDARTGERRPRPAERGRTRALHRAQRGLSRAVRLPLHHGGEGQDQGRDFGGVRAAARATTAPAEFGAALLEIDRDRRASPPGDTALNGASRLLRGRLLSFGDSPRLAGASALQLVEDGAVWIENGLIVAAGRGARSRGAGARRRRDRRSRGQADPARLHRRAHPLSADPRDRLLWRAAAGLAAKIHVRRRAEVFRSAPMRTSSRGSFSTRCSARGRRRRWSIARSARNRSTRSSPRASAAARG